MKSPWYRVRKGLFLHGRDLAASCSAECRMRAFIQTRCFGPWDTVIESRLHYHKLACSGPYDIPKLPAATHPCTEYWTPSNGIGSGRQYYSVRNTSFPTGEHAAIHYTRQQDLFCRLPIVYVKSPQDLRTLYAPYSQPAYLFLEIRRRKKTQTKHRDDWPKRRCERHFNQCSHHITVGTGSRPPSNVHCT